MSKKTINYLISIVVAVVYLIYDYYQDKYKTPDENIVYSDMKVPESWSKVKNLARDDVYANRSTTFYCGCSYRTRGESGGGTIKQSSCYNNQSKRPHEKRSAQLEWEHVVPASLMPARQRACWNEGLPQCSKPGRSCCEKHDPTAKAMMFDLHNLVPSVGQINALRANLRYGNIPGEQRAFSSCDFEWTGDLVEPPKSKHGDVARIWLYMADRYALSLSEKERNMYLDWHKSDPPSLWEIRRNERIAKIQGNENPWVTGNTTP